VCVGIAPRKTLTKLANHVAKKRLEFGAICDFNAMPKTDVDALLDGLEVGDVWGIGPRLSGQLKQVGILTARELRDADAFMQGRRLNVGLEKTVRELNGLSCMELEDIALPRKQITSSRSFGKYVTDIADLQQATALYVRLATEKLRAQHSLTNCLHVSLHTNPHSTNLPQHSNFIAPAPQTISCYS